MFCQSEHSQCMVDVVTVYSLIDKKHNTNNNTVIILCVQNAKLVHICMVICVCMVPYRCRYIGIS